MREVRFHASSYTLLAHGQMTRLHHSGERTRLACCFRRLAETTAGKFGMASRHGSEPEWREHASRVRSPDSPADVKMSTAWLSVEPLVASSPGPLECEVSYCVGSFLWVDCNSYTRSQIDYEEQRR